eukprot:SAG31_NODE_123_length_23712_cov_41.426291_31_plen_59_part_00
MVIVMMNVTTWTAVWMVEIVAASVSRVNLAAALRKRHQDRSKVMNCFANWATWPLHCL